MYGVKTNNRSGLMGRLYREFAEFYEAERCQWAPENPRRVFNLAFRNVYPRYKERLSREEFVGLVYEVLGYQGACPLGLFQTFDPALYHGRLPFPDHFLNLFRVRLVGRVRDRLRRAAQRACREHEAEQRRVGRGRHDHADQDQLAALREGLGLLAPVEFAVVYMTYWGRSTHREMAAALGLDRKTVKRRHDAAVDRLRSFLDASHEIAA